MTTITATPARTATRVRFRIPPAPRLLVHAVLIITALLWLEPTVGLLITSLRAREAISSSGWWMVLAEPRLTLQNYEAVLMAQGMGNAFLNSFKIAVPGTVLTVFIASLVAYALAWIEFPGRQAIFLIVITLLVIPIQTTLVPVLQLFNQLSLTGTYVGIWLAHTGYGLPFAIYLLRNFFASLPREIMESARIDGANDWTIFLRLILPLSVPALASLAIFQFMWVWNDLLVALIYLGGKPSVAPMPLTIANLTNSLGQGWQLLTAAAFLSMLLPLIIFFSMQRYFVRGILAGSVKG